MRLRSALCSDRHSDTSLSGTADGQFYIGAAVEPRQLQGPEGELLKRQVNTLTAENAMKMYALWTGNDSAAYRWAAADRIVDFARENGMKVRGHTLIWHNAPAAFFKDENGNDLDSAALYRRTEAYMRAVLTHFDSTVFCWDVVNEAIAERDGEGSIYRQDSPWYRICGADYIAWAFRTAHRIRPDMKLFYNDYSLVYPDKLQRTLTMLRQLLAEGVPIDGVGMQAHWNNAVTAEQIQAAVDSFAMLGLDIHITELDLTIYGNYHDGARQATTATLPYDAETSRAAGRGLRPLLRGIPPQQRQDFVGYPVGHRRQPYLAQQPPRKRAPRLPAALRYAATTQGGILPGHRHADGVTHITFSREPFSSLK